MRLTGLPGCFARRAPALGWRGSSRQEPAMEYVRFGQTGLTVSRLCLGCMTYGDPGWREWVLDEEASRPFIREALERGINFFDTADMYSLGRSEEVVGRALKEMARRDEVVIATKVFNAMGPKPNQQGPLAQAHHGGDRRLAEAARHRLRRPLHHPSLRPRDARRGDDRGALGRGEGRQGALSRRLLDVGLAVHEDARPAAGERLRALRVDAELRQPDLPRGGARDAAALPRRRASP